MVVLPLFLSGCFTHYHRAHPFNLNQTDLGANVQEAFASQGVAPGEIFYDHWWSFFKDPQLDRLITLGLNANPTIYLADSKIRLACYEAKIARSTLYPHVFAVADVARQKISEYGPGFVPGFPTLFTDTTLELTTMTYQLDLWEKNRSLYYAALDQVQAEIANYEQAKLLLSTTIAAVYFDWQMQLARKKVTEERLAVFEETFDLLWQQFRLGIISEFRLYETDTQIQSLKDLIYQIDGQIEIDQHALSALVGNALFSCREENLAPPKALFNQPFPLPITLPIDLLNRRPDITAWKWLVESYCYDIKAAKADFLPRIDLMAYAGFESIFIKKLFTAKALIADGEGKAILPIFTAGKLRARLGIAWENLESAIDNYNQTVLDAIQEVSNALTNLTVADERKTAITQALKDSAELLDLTEQRYENAIYSKIAVLSAKASYLNQKDLEVQIDLARYESAVQLIRAIGGGYHEPCR